MVFVNGKSAFVAQNASLSIMQLCRTTTTRYGSVLVNSKPLRRHAQFAELLRAKHPTSFCSHLFQGLLSKIPSLLLGKTRSACMWNLQYNVWKAAVSSNSHCCGCPAIKYVSAGQHQLGSARFPDTQGDISHTQVGGTHTQAKLWDQTNLQRHCDVAWHHQAW